MEVVQGAEHRSPRRAGAGLDLAEPKAKPEGRRKPSRVIRIRAGGDWLTGFPAPLAAEGCQPSLLVRGQLVSQVWPQTHRQHSSELLAVRDVPHSLDDISF